MLVNKRWAPSNAMQLMAHSDMSWSGPGGWISLRVRPSLAWLVLCAVSVVPYVTIPLSGFTMELTRGFSSKSSNDGDVSVTGQTKETFLDQNLEDVFTRSFIRWRSSAPSVLHGRSAFYVPADNATQLDRSWIQYYPNTWPDQEHSTVFIAPQSIRVVSGRAWGLEVNITCSNIDSVDKFELLSQRNDDRTAPRCPPINFNSSGESPEYEGLPSLCDFDVYQLGQLEDAAGVYINYPQSQITVGEMEVAVKYDSSSYEGASDPWSDPSPVTYEVALWQNPVKLSDDQDLQCTRLKDQVSNDIGTVVSGMRKEFRLTDASLALTGQTDQSPIQLDAIGVQCKSTFRTGSATITGTSGTYESFSNVAAVPLVSATPVPAPTAVPRLFRSEISAALNLQDMLMTDALNTEIQKLPVDFTSGSNMDLNPVAWIASNTSWLMNIYRSVDAFERTPLYCDDPATTSTWQQLQLINSTQLRTSLVRAHKAYAIEMSKPNRVAPSAALLNNNLDFDLRPLQPTSLISPGKVSPLPVLILLILWSLSMCLLGVVFGLPPRWSETLDGFSMFCFGSENPHFRSKADPAINVPRSYSECKELLDMPGMIGYQTMNYAGGLRSLRGGGVKRGQVTLVSR